MGESGLHWVSISISKLVAPMYCTSLKSAVYIGVPDGHWTSWEGGHASFILETPWELHDLCLDTQSVRDAALESTPSSPVCSEKFYLSKHVQLLPVDLNASTVVSDEWEWDAALASSWSPCLNHDAQKSSLTTACAALTYILLILNASTAPHEWIQAWVCHIIIIIIYKPCERPCLLSHLSAIIIIISFMFLASPTFS